ncbi:MAG: glycosyltransferase [Tepidisphaerales bacterium]
MSVATPRYSIVVTYYQGTQPREVFLRGMSCLQRQSYRNFEVLVYHDGPLLDPGVPSPFPIRATPQRYNDWGHSLRDLGIREARGDYILHFNADNILYPNALETLEYHRQRPSYLIQPDGKVLDNPEVLVFAIHLNGYQRHFRMWYRHPPEARVSVLLTGNPPERYNIDCLQMVVSRRIWLEVGGWYDKQEESDGVIYQAIAEKYGYRCIPAVLGEHN